MTTPTVDAVHDLGVLPDWRQEPLIDCERVARITGSDVKTVRGMARRGELPVIRLGRLIRIKTRPFVNAIMSDSDWSTGE